MKFRYTEIPNHQDPANPFYRPYVITRLARGSNQKLVIALVDSGADLSLFHSDIGKLIGIDIDQGSKLHFQGVSGAGAVAYVHQVELAVRGFNSIVVNVGFTDSMVVGTGILGNRGCSTISRLHST